MNMSIINSERIQQNLTSFIAEEVLAVAQVKGAEQEMLTHAKQFLDRHFPLNEGSHQNVTSYVVYYQHLLAFFEDGSHSGLAQPKQFVAFNGTKDSPTALVLRDQGCHVELCFDRSGMIGARNLAHLDDVQIIEAAKKTQECRRLSLLHTGTPSANDTPDRFFTAKDGSVYDLQNSDPKSYDLQSIVNL
ncbi:malate synthase [Shewanella sp. A25]|nr:malate synthase [Shewanella shenzhenensis]